jgi:small subunit ribosomal protein S3
MGQKVNPVGLRIGIIRDWESKWFANKKDYADLVNEDLRIRTYVFRRLKDAAVASIEIERAANRINVAINTAKPGMVIGKGGTEVDALRNRLNALTGKRVHISISEIKTPDLMAQLVADNIATQLERRVSFRRAMKQAIQRTMRSGAKGIRVQVAGRLGGAEIARTEGYSEGTVPLHTLRADIDYALSEAATTYGRIGVKVWIYRGEVLQQRPRRSAEEGGK